jgi:O-antigen ligase
MVYSIPSHARERTLTSSPTAAERTTFGLLATGALLVVLAATPYKAFELDRHLLPKELVVHVVATLAATLCLLRVRRFPLVTVDLLLLVYLGLSLVSTLFATNLWLGFRSLGLSLSGAALFWSARRVARAGLGPPLVATVAAASVIGAVTALLQAYGFESDLMSLTRAPGGTYGNRNFMAHAAVIGLPALLLTALTARSRIRFALSTAGLASVAGALTLSRSRAAWLAVGACLAMLLVDRLSSPLRFGPRHRRRLQLLGLGVLLGIALALVVPNTLDWRSDSPYLDSLKGMVNYQEGSGKGRLEQYASTIRLALRHPILGVGPGNWSVAYPAVAGPDDPSLDQEGMTANPWPSSDWMAYLSERGIPAFLALSLLLVGAGLIGWAHWRAESRGGDGDQVDLAPLALAATVVAAMVTGAFDAVLLSPTPTYLVWTLLGALAPAEPRRSPRWELHLAPRWVLVTVITTGLALVMRSTLQVAAMARYGTGWSTARMEEAARLDPGSYRIAIRLAERASRRRRCDMVRHYAGRAARLYPEAEEPRQLLARCKQ